MKHALAVAAAVALTACAARPLADCPAGATAATAELLYFGTATPGGVVSEAEWQAFVRNEVTPRFPQGLTTWRADGQWRGADGKIVREGSHVLSLLHARDSRADAAIAAIVAAYKSQFRQESVLRVTSQACSET
jgi:hypothetical protein